MATFSQALCSSNFISTSGKQGSWYPLLLPGAALKRVRTATAKERHSPHVHQKRMLRRFTVFAITEGSAKSKKSEENSPSWARPDSDESPPWAKDEGKDNAPQQGFTVPFYVYLLASAVTAIAAIGSVFEYLNQKPVFGILNSDSIFYVPVLGFFAFTGIPTSAFLWFKSVQAANKEAEEQDRRDGYM